MIVLVLIGTNHQQSTIAKSEVFSTTTLAKELMNLTRIGRVFQSLFSHVTLLFLFLFCCN